MLEHAWNSVWWRSVLQMEASNLLISRFQAQYIVETPSCSKTFEKLLMMFPHVMHWWLCCPVFNLLHCHSFLVHMFHHAMMPTVQHHMSWPPSGSLSHHLSCCYGVFQLISSHHAPKNMECLFLMWVINFLCELIFHMAIALFNLSMVLSTILQYNHISAASTEFLTYPLNAHD